MKTTVISDLVTTPVTLGSGGYTEKLLITTTGTVNVQTPTTPSRAVYAPAGLSAVSLNNEGLIVYGLSNYAVDFASKGDVTNTGEISGNFGVLLETGGDVTNNGTILSDNGAVTLDENGSVYNTGELAATFSSSAVTLESGGHINNSGSITGGGNAGGGNRNAAIYAGGTAQIRNSGGIGGGGFPQSEAAGATGIDLNAGGSVVNMGVISGGAGGSPPEGTHVGGGDGVYYGAFGDLSNSGSIEGGYAGGEDGFGDPGGDGVDLAAGGNALNSGFIVGGAGAPADPDAAGAGGTGILSAGGTLSNSGTILGGAGGSNGSSDSSGANGGNAIQGLNLVTNTGTISGGNGGRGGDNPYYGFGGSGGAGVDLNSLYGTLINAGLISGGTGGTGGAGNGSLGDAAILPSSSVLIIDPGAEFIGNVVAALNNDILELAGKTAGTLTGLGSQFTGFTEVEVLKDAQWNLVGTNSLDVGEDLRISGSAYVTGSLSVAGSVTGNGTLTIGPSSAASIAGSCSVSSVVFATGDSQSSLSLSPPDFAGKIVGFGTGDTIDLISYVVSSDKFSHGKLMLVGNEGERATLAFAGEYATGNFAFISDGADGTDVTFNPIASGVVNPDISTRSNPLPTETTAALMIHPTSHSLDLLSLHLHS